MIDRYTRPEMGGLWTLENKFQQMLAVEKAVADVQGDLGLIPSEAAKAIVSKGDISVDRIQKLEEETRHDVIAFVSNISENVGAHGRYVHYGLTSSDVLDTALSLQIQQAGGVLEKSLSRLEQALESRMYEHKDTLCAGRTHGMHAEPTSFGVKLAGFLAELRRNKERFNKAVEQARVGQLSGAVGSFSVQPMEVEKKVCEKLGLEPEPLSTQVIPRDRHAELMSSLAMLGSGLERLATELRHLQRTEIGEVQEGFAPGQKGSSAMPHKKNPISAENITGLARLLRSYVTPAMENVALWHERDISHSSVERVIIPDAFIVCDYAVDRMAGVMENLVVNKETMKENMEASRGQLFSSHVLLALVDKGLNRNEAYQLVQRVSHSLKDGEHLLDRLKNEQDVTNYLKEDELEEIFSGRRHQKTLREVIQRLE